MSNHKARIAKLETRTAKAETDAPIYQVIQDDGRVIVTYLSGRKVIQDTPGHCKTYVGGFSPDDWENTPA